MVEPTDGTSLPSPKGETDHRAIRAAIKQFRANVLENSVDVGSQFAAEARRIHDLEVPPRSIYGQATREEALGLIEDGISFLPLPPAADDQN